MSEILVVDDDRDLRDSIREVLENEGLETTCAASADEALTLARSTPFHIILLDMVMPGTDGMVALPLLKKLRPRCRIIVITAFATVQHAVQALQQGADDYLTKPFKIETLLALVRRNLEEIRLRDASRTGDLDGIFHGLANLLRRRILQVLRQQGTCRFMDLVRALEVEDHTKVNFHLKILREAGFIAQDEARRYVLTELGDRTSSCVCLIAETLAGREPKG